MYNKDEVYDFIFLGEKNYKTSKKDKIYVVLLVLVLLIGFILVK